MCILRIQTLLKAAIRHARSKHPFGTSLTFPATVVVRFQVDCIRATREEDDTHDSGCSFYSCYGFHLTVPFGSAKS